MSGSTARRGLVTMLLVGALLTAVNVPRASAAVTTVGGGAFGVAGQLAVPPGGPQVVVPPYPEVTLPPEGEWERNGAASADYVVVAAGLLQVFTRGLASQFGNANVASSAQANNVFVLDEPGLPSVTATEISSECSSNERDGSTGSASLVHASVNFRPLPAAPEPNTVIDLAAGVRLHLNEQIVRDVPGAETNITVNALRMSIDIPMVARGEVIVSQSRCSVFGSGVLVPPAS